MMCSSAFNVINMTFVGRSIGPLGLAAIAICSPLTMIQNSIAALVSNGCSAAVAITLGRGDSDGARELLGSSIFFNFCLAGFNIALGFMFMDPLLRAFGASDVTISLAMEYYSVQMLGMIFGGLSALNPMLRIEGYPQKAMFTMLMMAVVNIILAPLFIFVFGWGIRGAAFASFLAQGSTAGYILLFITKKERVVRLVFQNLKFRLNRMFMVVQLGLPNFLMQVTQSMLSIVLNKSLLTYGGDIAISAWGVTNNINNLVAQPVFGLNQGAQPIIGYNYGAKKYRRVKIALIYSLCAATLFSLLGWVMTRFFAEQIIAFFNNDPELIAVGSRMLIVFRMFIIVVGFQQAGAAYFQYCGRPMTSIFLTLSRQVIFLIPCILILSKTFLLDGILYSGPISDVLSTVMTAVFIIIEFRRLDKVALEEEAAIADVEPEAVVEP
jgi:putative MATE family efflux protein